jgi:hypothetical protein
MKRKRNEGGHWNKGQGKEGVRKGEKRRKEKIK